jgi:hypothetical protein
MIEPLVSGQQLMALDGTGAAGKVIWFSFEYSKCEVVLRAVLTLRFDDLCRALQQACASVEAFPLTFAGSP